MALTQSECGTNQGLDRVKRSATVGSREAAVEFTGKYLQRVAEIFTRFSPGDA